MNNEPKFYAIDPLDAYPEPVGTLDKIERSNGALWVHLNGKRSKLIGLQSLDFLISQLVEIRGEVFGNKPAAQGEPVAWELEVEGYKTVLIDNYQRALSEQEHFQGRGRTAAIHNLYRGQPAPVAVVLPGEQQIHTMWGGCSCLSCEFSRGWNTCLDEVARLNPG